MVRNRLSSNGYSRRDFLKGALTGASGVASAMVLGAACSPAPPAPAAKPAAPEAKPAAPAAKPAETEVNVITYGGPMAEFQRTKVGPDLQQKYGISLSITEGQTPPATVASQKADPQFDLFTDSLAYIPRYRAQGIYATITEQEVPALKNVYPQLLKAGENRVIPVWAHAACIAYHEKHFSKPPTLEDFADPKYKGKIAFQASPDSVLAMPMILPVVGATADKPEPMFAWFEKVMPNVLTIYGTVAQMAQLLEREEVWLGIWYTGRVSELRNRGVPVNYSLPPTGGTAIINGFAIPPNAKHPQAARKYLDLLLQPEHQATMSQMTFFGPTTANTKLNPDLAAKLPTYGEEGIKKLLVPDWDVINSKMDDWIARFDKLAATYVGR